VDGDGGNVSAAATAAAHMAAAASAAAAAASANTGTVLASDVPPVSARQRDVRSTGAGGEGSMAAPRFHSLQCARSNGVRLVP
jgi:hypothetical protein